MLSQFGDAGMERDLFQLDTLPRDSYDCCPALRATEAEGGDVEETARFD